MQKTCKNVPKMPTIRQYSTVFDIIRHYLTLFDIIRTYSTLFDFKKGIRFLYQKNRLACFHPIRVPNSKMNTEYFQIIFFNRIIHPSLEESYLTHNPRKFLVVKFSILNFIFFHTLFYHKNFALEIKCLNCAI